MKRYLRQFKHLHTLNIYSCKVLISKVLHICSLNSNVVNPNNLYVRSVNISKNYKLFGKKYV